MPCLIVMLAIFFPRLILVLLAVFTHYLHNAFETWYWPLLGFLFLPFTTLAYALAMNSNHHAVSGIYLVVILIAFLMDVGSLGGSGYSRRRRR